MTESRGQAKLSLGSVIEELPGRLGAPEASQRPLRRAAGAPVPAVLEACETLVQRTPPEYQFQFRLPYDIATLVDLPLPVADPANPPPRVAVSCVPVLAGRFSIVADLRLRQTWSFQQLYIGDLSSSISLAPGERLNLTIKKTQRTQLNQTTLNSSESLDSFESSVVDKDVLNIQRSSVSTQQWRVDANANVSLLGVLTVGGGGGFTSSATESANTAIEQIAEVTTKSARRLQALQKIEVARQDELTTETAQTRTITNPYRDRSLTLHVYELAKRFAVTTDLAEVRPALVMEITDLDLDRDFVLAQGELLDEIFLDRSLAAELREALLAVRTTVVTDHRALARRYARLAFHFLFEANNLFNLDGGDPAENSPWASFADEEGLEDAIDNELGRVFTTLGVYLRLQAEIYSRPPFGPPPILPNPPPWPGASGRGHDLEVEMALSLAQAIREPWTALGPDSVENILDVGDRTEVARRISGFLSLVDGLIKPLLTPIEEEREAAEARNRAEAVIDRVLRHIQCNRTYYVERFLAGLSQRTHGYALAEAFSQIVRSGTLAALNPGQEEALLELFNPRLGYLDGLQFVVPLRQAMSLGAALRLIADLTGGPPPAQEDLVFPDQQDLTIPTDGFHLEPIAGRCVLADVPEAGGSVTANINVEAHEG